ncbi:MAG TPA: HEAT repeat domain-containing protein [Planctomycetaceae bacterium]|nr:HEAT repeat domain-containing protein [Planctomycetaceae bacterium]
MTQFRRCALVAISTALLGAGESSPAMAQADVVEVQEVLIGVPSGVATFPQRTSTTGAAAAPSGASESPVRAPRPKKDPDSVPGLLERLDDVHRELIRLKVRPAPLVPAEKQPQLHVILETPFAGANYYGSPNSIHYFACRLRFVNLTGKAVTVASRQIALKADDKTLMAGDIPSQLRGAGFSVGNRGFSLSSPDLQTPETLAVPAGGTAATWVAFAPLPGGGQVPKLTLEIPWDANRLSLNVNEFALGLMRRSVERIGPRQSLAIIRIAGEMNAVNVQELVRVFDELALAKVARAVICWDEQAPPVDSQIWNWLMQSAAQAGQGQVQNRQNQQFPTVPAAIRELHLAELPQQNASNVSSSNATTRVHQTLAGAASAALRTAYEALPPEDLLDEIERGNPLTRVAAIAGGGGRLPDDKLPLLLAFTGSREPAIQAAAVEALRHFGDPRAIGTLASLVRQNRDPLSIKACESLAASRFVAAHDVLMGLLRESSPELKRKIVQVLARFPRPLWSDVIYEFVRDPGSEINGEALQALVTVGHPQLFPLLEQALKSGNAALEQTAFNTLVNRSDPESEELALAWTLERLRTAPPSPQMQQFLSRTRDPRAVPLLLDQLRRTRSGRSGIIGLLAQIGDQNVAEVLVDMYPGMDAGDQRTALQTLRQLQSPVFRQLAGKALLSKDMSLVSVAVSGLSADASDEAARMLVEAFDKSTEQRVWSYTANALGQIGTADARQVLVKARDAGPDNKRQYAMNALRNMRSRSPGYQVLYQAQYFEQQKQWKEAVERYDVAIKLDPDLPDSYAGRGEALVMLDKLEEARKDFARGYELDPYNGKAASGLAKILVRLGKLDEALQQIEEARPKSEKNPYDGFSFAYNAACVYGRAIEQLEKDQQAPDREKRLAEYRQKAVTDLQTAVQKGFQDFEKLKSDPDLAALRDLPEFKKIHSPAEQPDAAPDAAPAADQAVPAARPVP